MKKIIINSTPEAAANQFVELLENPDVTIDFSVIPKKIGESPKFWAELVKAKPELIARVPLEISSKEEFCGLIDHEIFFNYIPDKFLSIQDLDKHEANPKAAIFATGARVELENHEKYTWYQFTNCSYWFSNPDAITVFNRQVDYIARGEELYPELWTQELADLIWEYHYFFRCYNQIPTVYIRDDWAKLMNLYSEKRVPILGDERRPNEARLPEYWSSFQSPEEMETALRLEEEISKSVTPGGYAVQISLSGDDELVDTSAYYQQMWQVIEPVIADDTGLVEKFFKFYDAYISKYISDPLFNLDWLKDSDMLDLGIYKLYKRQLDRADSPVAAEKAKRQLAECTQYMKDILKIYRDISDAEAEKLLNAIFESVQK